MEKKTYILLNDLEVYKLARELSKLAWEMFITLDWETKKIVGFQFVEATDSIGANIAEGYNRFHYLDKIKFYYNARGSLSESSDHWLELLKERNKVKQIEYNKYKSLANKLSLKLHNFISSTYRAKQYD